MGRLTDITKWPEVMASLERLNAKGFTPVHLLGAVKARDEAKRERENKK
jgi:hypothetical protein